MNQNIVYSQGLSNKEVEERRAAGKGNTPPERITKTNGQIIKDNVCTLFNLLNFLIAIALAVVGAYTNMFFILIIIINICIGIAQEIHAKNLVDKLSLISTPKAQVFRNGKKSEIAFEELVIDDILIFDSGQQISADAAVVYGNIEVNESLLTGESDSIVKQPADHLLSGSYVVSGKCYAQVEHVGLDNYAAKIAHEAKKHKTVNSELLLSMRKITRFTSFLIVPLGILLFLEAFLLRQDIVKDAVVSTAAGLLGMLPKGLFLLISIALATGVIKLAKKKVLVQELYALETLAHVDVLCLDKTGTITEGKMSVTDVFQTPNISLPASFETLMGSFLHHADDNNATFVALKEHFSVNSMLQPTHKIPFSSQRKWSAISFKDMGTFVIGAPERLSSKPLPKEVAHLENSGVRLLMAAYSPEKIEKEALPSLTPLSIISIKDPIRANAKETLDYFAKEGVDIKVISGDNPLTISAIVKEAGLEGADNIIDMTTVETDEEITKAAGTYTVYGRVNPHQKSKLIKAFKQQGHTVAMTGDGVNDVLALKEADCSIAMAEGSDAARQVSQLVLLNSDFSSLPDVLSEGRRVVNNVTRLAGIFFVKTIYSVILSILCVLANIPFPFIPIQITLIDLAIEGYPSFFSSFEPDGRKITGSFLQNVFKRAIPNALTIVINLTILYIITNVLSIPQEESLMVMYYMVGFVSILAVLKACIPFNKLRVFLFSTVAVGFYVAVLLFHSLLELPLPTVSSIPYLIGFAVLSILFERLFNVVTERIFKKSQESRLSKRRIS